MTKVSLGFVLMVFGLSAVGAYAGQPFANATLRSTCEILRQQLTQEIRSELGFPEMAKVSSELLSSLSPQELQRLTAYAKKMISGVDPFWNLLDTRQDHSAFREVGGEMMDRIESRLAGQTYRDAFSDENAFSRFVRDTAKFRETILFLNPNMGVGRRFKSPQLLHPTRYAGFADLIVRNDLNLATGRSQDLVTYTRKNAAGQDEEAEFPLSDFVELFMDNTCRSQSSDRSEVNAVAITERVPAKRAGPAPLRGETVPRTTAGTGVAQ